MFFFSSRRRHTRFKCDWSSDVCSSDLILNSVREQGKLDAALEAAILAADSKGRLEDVYLPFKPKRRTKAEIAKEAGLEPPAALLLGQPEEDPPAAAPPFLNTDHHVGEAPAPPAGPRAPPRVDCTPAPRPLS